MLHITVNYHAHTRTYDQQLKNELENFYLALKVSYARRQLISSLFGSNDVNMADGELDMTQINPSKIVQTTCIEIKVNSSLNFFLITFSLENQ